MKTNLFIGKFFDRTFYVVERVRAYAQWKFIDSPWLSTTVLDPQRRSFGMK